MIKHARLLYSGEISAQEPIPFFEQISEDLQLNAILLTMGSNDKNIIENCRRILSMPITVPSELLYRQAGVRDALEHPKAVTSIYNSISESLTNIANFKYNRRHQAKSQDPYDAISYQVALLELAVQGFEALKSNVSKYYERFSSQNFKSFCDDLLAEYDERFNDFVHERAKSVDSLSLGSEIQISATIGEGLKMRHFLVNNLEEYRAKHKFDLVDSLFQTVIKKDELSIPHSETKLLTDCSELRRYGLLHIADAYAQIFDDFATYLTDLRDQLAFYYGCINLYAAISNIQCSTCFPSFEHPEQNYILADGLYDIYYAVTDLKAPVSSSLTKENASVTLITGTNNGGKTTFLRSLGVSQLLAQSGLFVPAKSMSTGIFKGIYTLFSKEHSRRLDSSHLEDELGALSKIIDVMETHSLILLNEAFASPSEKESVAIAGDVMRAFTNNQITCFFVTHIYSFAKKLYEEDEEHTACMQAGKDEQGQRTYEMVYGEPGETGYGMEIYKDILGSILKKET